jgi:predicted PurR-regulated permease PerM
MISAESQRDFALRVLTAAGLVALVFILVYISSLLFDMLLLTFAGVLLAVGIDGLVRLLQRYLPLSRTPALIVALLLVIAMTAIAVLLIVPPAAAQLPLLIEQLPQAARELGDFLRQIPGMEGILDGDDDERPAFLSENVLGRIAGIFGTAFGAIGSLLLILLIGFYVVLNPTKYARHIVLLFPRGRRARVAAVLATQGRALRLWLLSRLISMVFVGVVTALGLSLLGVPMAMALGLLAGLLTFIPYLGPVLAAIPTGLVALLVDPQLALFAVAFYFAVETVEGNVITPLAAQGVVHVPAAYTVVVQIAGGFIAGLPGVILATPLAVAAAVAIQMLYIEDTLGDDVEVLGGEVSPPAP